MGIMRGDVGRVGDNQIKFMVGERTIPIAFDESDRRAKGVCVLLGNAQGIKGLVESGHLGVGQFQCKCHGNGPAAGSQIQNTRRGVRFQTFIAGNTRQCLFHQYFCFRARDQYMFVHGKITAVKFAAAENLRDRHTRGAGGDVFCKLRGLLVGQMALAMGQQKSTR